MILIYLITLFIAPQLWLEPFVGLRTDFLVYPAWIAYLFGTSKIKNFFRFNAQDAFFLLMLLWIMVTTVVNEIHEFSLKILIDYIKWFVLYRMVALTLDSDDKLAATMGKIVFIVMIVAVQAIDHKYFSPDLIGWAGQPLGWVDDAVILAGGTGRTQWVNIFDGPGVFCVMFTVALPFLLMRLDPGNSFFRKLMALVLIAVLVLAIWTTGSRGGFLATLAILGSYYMSRLNVSFFTLIKIGGVLVVLFMLAPTHLTQVKDDKRSAQHRVDMWQEGVEMLEQNPVFGIGKGNFAVYTGRLIAHNSFIEIMGELGGPGIVFWVAMIFCAFKTLRIYATDEECQRRQSLARGLSICLIGYLVSSFFVTLEYETFYFLLGMCRSISLRKKLSLEIKLEDYIAIFSIIVGMYVVLKVFVRIYY